MSRENFGGPSGMTNRQMIDIHRQAIENDPKNVSSMIFLGTCLIEEKQYDEAIQILQKAMAIDPQCEQSCKNQIQAIMPLIEGAQYGENKVEVDNNQSREMLPMIPIAPPSENSKEPQITKDWKEIKTQSTDQSDYMTSFYWTTFSYFSGSHLNNSTDYQLQTKELVNQLDESLPDLQEVIHLMDQAILDVYRNIKSKDYENKTKSIIKYMRDNYQLTDLHRTIAQVAMQKAKMDIPIQQVQPEDPKQIDINLGPNSFQTFLNERISQFISSVQHKKFGLYATQYGEQALQDVLKMLLYLATNEKKICKTVSTFKKLEILLVDAAAQNTFQDWVCGVDGTQSSKQKEATNTSCACKIM